MAKGSIPFSGIVADRARVLESTVDIVAHAVRVLADQSLAGAEQIRKVDRRVLLGLHAHV